MKVKLTKSNSRLKEEKKKIKNGFFPEIDELIKLIDNGHFRLVEYAISKGYFNGEEKKYSDEEIKILGDHLKKVGEPKGPLNFIKRLDYYSLLLLLTSSEDRRDYKDSILNRER